MDDKLKYPGKELEIFDKAILWRKYLFKKIKKYIGKEILEVGAGMGSFTKNYFQNDQKIVLSELDTNLLEILNYRFKKFSNIQIKSKYTKNIENQFDSILYISVLEHIEDDVGEIKTALDKLKNGGSVKVDKLDTDSELSIYVNGKKLSNSKKKKETEGLMLH